MKDLTAKQILAIEKALEELTEEEIETVTRILSGMKDKAAQWMEGR